MPCPRLIQRVQDDVLTLAIILTVVGTLHVIQDAAISGQLRFPQVHLDDLGDRHKQVQLLLAVQQEIVVLQGIQNWDTANEGVKIHRVVLRPVSRSQHVHQEGDADQIRELSSRKGLSVQALRDDFLRHVAHHHDIRKLAHAIEEGP